MNSLTLTKDELSVLQGYEFSPKNLLGVLHGRNGVRELIKVRSETVWWWGRPPFGNLDVSLKGVSDYLCTKLLPGPDSPVYGTIHAIAEQCLFAKVDGSRRIAQLWQKLGESKSVKYIFVAKEIDDHGPHCQQISGTFCMELAITPKTTFKHIFAQFEMLGRKNCYDPHVHGTGNIQSGDYTVHLAVCRNNEKRLDP